MSHVQVAPSSRPIRPSEALVSVLHYNRSDFVASAQAPNLLSFTDVLADSSEPPDSQRSVDVQADSLVDALPGKRDTSRLVRTIVVSNTALAALATGSLLRRQPPRPNSNIVPRYCMDHAVFSGRRVGRSKPVDDDPPALIVLERTNTDNTKGVHQRTSSSIDIGALSSAQLSLLTSRIKERRMNEHTLQKGLQTALIVPFPQPCRDQSLAGIYRRRDDPRTVKTDLNSIRSFIDAGGNQN